MLPLQPMVGETAGVLAVSRTVTRVTSRPDWLRSERSLAAQRMPSPLRSAEVHPVAAMPARPARPARPCLREWSDQRSERARQALGRSLLGRSGAGAHREGQALRAG